jgi:hypothetical protein
MFRFTLNHYQTFVQKPSKHNNSSSFKVLYECLIVIQCESKGAATKSDILSETELCLTDVLCVCVCVCLTDLLCVCVCVCVCVCEHCTQRDDTE